MRPKTCKHGVCPCSGCKQCKAERNAAYRKTATGKAVNLKVNREYQRDNYERFWAETPVVMRFRSILVNMRRRKHCAIKVGDLLHLWEQQEGCCAYCGTEMTYERGGRKTTTVSVDRINSARHYTVDNIVLSCWACNSGKNIMTADEYIAHCRKVAERHPDALRRNYT